jgi:uncharacterized protein
MTSKAFLAAIRIYQAVFSPFLGGHCRFMPSCSVYAAEAIEVHGAWRGGWLALRRLASCHPFGRYGADPVPDAAFAAAQLRRAKR